ncbi:hypothetical protein QYM36_019701 [Artemia franciscana]|uniref:Uncharacterized protein n=1 Tax=Artemia franciscana TaxID=6661 RepID=A0AA88H4X6_ARTSF|nr:hypothetical protein QYM36_019701 [Artemia franciscana]
MGSGPMGVGVGPGDPPNPKLAARGGLQGVSILPGNLTGAPGSSGGPDLSALGEYFVSAYTYVPRKVYDFSKVQDLLVYDLVSQNKVDNIFLVASMGGFGQSNMPPCGPGVGGINDWVALEHQ